MKDGVVKHATAPVVATITNGKNSYPNMVHPQEMEGHDNPAYVQTFNNVDAITADIDHQHHNSQDEEEDHKALAQLSIVSQLIVFCFVWIYSFEFVFIGHRFLWALNIGRTRNPFYR
jgi:hypothetical protein